MQSLFRTETNKVVAELHKSCLRQDGIKVEKKKNLQSLEGENLSTKKQNGPTLIWCWIGKERD